MCLMAVSLLINAARAADLVVVQVALLKGELRTSMRAHQDHVNATGGLRGDTVHLVSLDDAATLGEVKYFEQSAVRAPAIEVAASSGPLDKPFEQVAQAHAEAIVSMLPVEEAAKLIKTLRAKGIFTPVKPPRAA